MEEINEFYNSDYADDCVIWRVSPRPLLLSKLFVNFD